MGHPQNATEIITDNSTASKILNNSCKQIRAKAIDMRYYWVRDRIQQKQFKLFWKKALENLADYFTKHHLPAHHKKMRAIYLYMKNMLEQTASEGVLIGHKRPYAINSESHKKGDFLAPKSSNFGPNSLRSSSSKTVDNSHKL